MYMRARQRPNGTLPNPRGPTLHTATPCSPNERVAHPSSRIPVSPRRRTIRATPPAASAARPSLVYAPSRVCVRRACAGERLSTPSHLDHRSPTDHAFIPPSRAMPREGARRHLCGYFMLDSSNPTCEQTTSVNRLCRSDALCVRRPCNTATHRRELRGERLDL